VATDTATSVSEDHWDGARVSGGARRAVKGDGRALARRGSGCGQVQVEAQFAEGELLRAPNYREMLREAAGRHRLE